IQNAATAAPITTGAGQAAALGMTMGAPGGAIAGGGGVALAPTTPQPLPEPTKIPEVNAIDEGRAVASAIFDDHTAPDIPGLTGTAIDTSAQADTETGLPPIEVAPEPSDDIDAELARIAPEPTQPEPIVSAPEPIRN